MWCGSFDIGFIMTRETLIKSNSPRSNAHTHAAEFDTLRFNQRVPRNSVRTNSSSQINFTVDRGSGYHRVNISNDRQP